MGFISRMVGRSADAELSADEAREAVRQGALLVDVREKSEWDAGHAPKARHVPLSSLSAVIDRLPAERRLVVVCRSGNRSARATRVLRDAGLDAVNLRGGMAAWRAAGGQVVGKSGRAGRVA